MKNRIVNKNKLSLEAKLSIGLSVLSIAMSIVRIYNMIEEKNKNT